MSGMQLTVFRADSGSKDVISIANISSNSSLTTEGPIVAFYGLYQSRNSCVTRLGGYKLLGSSELASESLHTIQYNIGT